MRDARTGVGHFAWVKWGVAALGAHGLLLWSVPSAPAEAALSAATTIAWEVETWEVLAPAPDHAAGLAEPEAIAAPLHAAAQVGVAPQAHVQARARANAAPSHRVRAAWKPAHAAPRAEQGSGVDGAPSLRADAAATGTVAPHPDETDAHAAAESGVAPAVAALGHETTAETTAETKATDEAAGARATGAAESGGGRARLAAGSGTGTSAAGALIRGPRLLATQDPCAGFFPGMAQANRGQVQLSVDVDAQGRPHPMQTLLELPRGQGFETAAKACAAHLHFAPALDAQGHPVSARARIALRFERS